jgi:nickel/cobalt exporter
MTDLSTLLQQGSTNIWIFIPSAIALGALHGLEPGHSKTMMAAFIIAIRGTVTQAVILGLSATLSHTAIVWIVALAGLHFGSQWNAETTEPYFQILSAVSIIAIATWMMWRTWRNEKESREHSHDHGHHHDHDHANDDHHHHHDETKHIDTGHGVIRVEIFEEGVPPRFRIFAEGERPLGWAANEVAIETERANGNRQAFGFIQRDGFLESAEEIPEPHEFMARVQLKHGSHSHDYDVEYTECGHAHALKGFSGLDIAAPGYQDPHELAHANDIRRRFATQEVTTGQIIMFGLTGGLIPCPAAITVLLLCLQLKKFTLGIGLVLCFSIGLALTMTLSGTLAALSLRHAAKHFSGFGDFVRKAPYFSGALIYLIGLSIAWQGVKALMHHG